MSLSSFNFHSPRSLPDSYDEASTLTLPLQRPSPLKRSLHIARGHPDVQVHVLPLKNDLSRNSIFEKKILPPRVTYL